LIVLTQVDRFLAQKDRFQGLIANKLGFLVAFHATKQEKQGHSNAGDPLIPVSGGEEPGFILLICVSHRGLKQ
jgi:hypothetical protein